MSKGIKITLNYNSDKTDYILLPLTDHISASMDEQIEYRKETYLFQMHDTNYIENSITNQLFKIIKSILLNYEIYMTLDYYENDEISLDNLFAENNFQKTLESNVKIQNIYSSYPPESKTLYFIRIVYTKGEG